MHQHTIIINIICIKPTLYTTYYMLCSDGNEFNSIKWIDIIIFGWFLINYELSKSVSKTVLEVYN